MNTPLTRKLLAILALTFTVGQISANPFPSSIAHQGLPGFLILPEHRYDPAVQRYLAERSLKALPLYDGQLYYVFPVSNASTHSEQMQIRYLESMLKNKVRDDEPASD